MYKDIIILYAHPQDNNMLVNISRVNYLYTIVLVSTSRSKVKLHGRNHGDKVKPHPQFCKWRERKRRALEN